jgi:hypothetical protein
LLLFPKFEELLLKGFEFTPKTSAEFLLPPPPPPPRCWLFWLLL